MKTFLIAAGLLMTGASVYGVVDYNKRQHTREFRELYNEKEKQDAPLPLGREVPVTTVKKDVKPEKVKIASLTKEPETVDAGKSVNKKSYAKKKKNRTLRLKEFSRAPLKD